MKRGYHFLLHKLISVAFAIFIVLTVEFVVLRVLEGPVIVPKGIDIGLRERTMEDWATNEPLVVQYFVFMKRMLTGDFGDSTGVWRGAEVSDAIYGYTARTAALFAFAAFLSIALGTLAGVLVSRWKDRVPGRAAALLELLLFSISAFIFSILIMWQIVGRFHLDWPLMGTFSSDYQSMNALEKTWDFAKHAALPIVSAVLACFGPFALVVREGILKALKEEERRGSEIASPDAGISIHPTHVSDVFLTFASHSRLLIVWVLSCVLVTESTFVWQGLGRLLWSSAYMYDFIVFQAAFFIIALLAIFSIFAWDIIIFLSGRDGTKAAFEAGIPEQAYVATSTSATAKLQSIWQEYRKSASGLIALCVFLALGIMAIVGPMVVKLDYGALGASDPDPVAHFVQGGREHYFVVFLTVLMSTVLGVVVGVISLEAKVLDRILMLLADAFLILPLLPLVVAVVVTRFYANPSVLQTALLLSVVMWAPIAMIVRDRTKSSRGAARSRYKSPDAVWLHLRDALSVGKFVAVISTLALTFLELVVLYYPHSWGAAIEWEYMYRGLTEISLDWILPVCGIVLLGMSFYKVLEHLERALTKIYEV
jgi:ABC-type dipeptide/oligopeptide/nickel transport system permease component